MIKIKNNWRKVIAISCLAPTIIFLLYLCYSGMSSDPRNSTNIFFAILTVLTVIGTVILISLAKTKIEITNIKEEKEAVTTTS